MTTDALLIHGAWQGGWAFGALVPELVACGWRCAAPDLPENGQPGAPPGPASLDAYVAHLSPLLAARTVLVAHSGAGVIASQLAEDHPDRVRCIIYLAGMMLPDGMAYEDLIRALIDEGVAAGGINPHLVWSRDRTFTEVPAAAAMEIFLHDCPPDAARSAAAALRPQRESGRILRASLTPERWGRTPKLYVEAVNDRSIVLAAQRRMQSLTPDAVVASIETGHVPQLAAPAALARALDAYVRSLGT